MSEKEDWAKIVFDKETGKGEYADKREEKEEGIVEHCEPVAHGILSENTATVLVDRLKEALGKKE